MHAEASENRDRGNRSRDKTISALLWSLVGVGVILRLVNPFFSNPLDFLITDPLRHYWSAKDCLQSGIHQATAYEILDPLGYQIWLSAVLRITGGDRSALALYTGALSIVAPWLWYRWMRLSLGDKQLALVGYAVLSLLPDWIKLYQFFLPETLLLPLIGLSLWLSWRVVEQPTAGRYLYSGFAWGCTLMTKLTALPLAVVALAWIYLKSAADKRLKRLSILTVAIAVLLFSLGPWKIYNRIHAFVPIPPGDYHRIWYESGKRDLRFVIKFNNNQQGYKEYVIESSSPSLELELGPPLDWHTKRTGTCSFIYDLTRTPDKYLPPSTMSLEDRLQYTIENIQIFFLGLSWPENYVEKDQKLGALLTVFKSVRFIWLPIAVAVIFLAVRKRRRDVMIALFASSLAFFLFQQSIILEARYKKPWEGIAIATLLSLIGSRSSRQAKTVSVENN